MKLKMKILTGIAALGLAMATHAQNLTATVLTNAAALSVPITTVLNGNLLGGTPFTYNGQTFLIATNSSGGLSVSTMGVSGTNVMAVPTTPDQAMAVASAWLGSNNPNNIGFYGTNEINARVGVAYLQNSGQAVAILSAQKYGIFGQANLGLGGGLLQGNNGGKSGTAGAYGEMDWRKPIGDVAAVGGVVAGWDNWNSKPFGGVKGGLEYRKSNHIGSWLDVIYAYEPKATDRGLLLAAGVEYAF